MWPPNFFKKNKEKIFFQKKKKKKKREKWGGYGHPHGAEGVAETTPKHWGWFQPPPWAHGGGQATPSTYWVVETTPSFLFFIFYFLKIYFLFVF
jgi:hypothetical protein